jgi:hypothetical protein
LLLNLGKTNDYIDENLLASPIKIPATINDRPVKVTLNKPPRRYETPVMSGEDYHFALPIN